jgi:hypothetical protein
MMENLKSWQRKRDKIQQASLTQFIDPKQLEGINNAIAIESKKLAPLLYAKKLLDIPDETEKAEYGEKDEAIERAAEQYTAQKEITMPVLNQETCPIEKITREQMQQIFKEKLPRGLFYYIAKAEEVQDGRYIGCNNVTGEANVEQFENIAKCRRWLRGFNKKQ